MKLILASRSASRRALLEAADVPHETMAAGVDEESAKAALRSDGLNARSLADALAELKATRLSMRFPEDFVLGCDQVLALEDGTMLDKPEDRDDARRQLTRMRGETHRLISAMVICQAGRPVWRHIEAAKLTMRAFSDAFLDDYLGAEWPHIAGCVGCYRMEGRGIQLFSKVEGSHSAILGLPLLPLLDYLRLHGVVKA